MLDGMWTLKIGGNLTPKTSEMWKVQTFATLVRLAGLYVAPTSKRTVTARDIRST